MKKRNKERERERTGTRAVRDCSSSKIIVSSSPHTFLRGGFFTPTSLLYSSKTVGWREKRKRREEEGREGEKEEKRREGRKRREEKRREEKRREEKRREEKRREKKKREEKRTFKGICL